MTDSSEIGHFGTLRLLKRNNPSTTIAFFPIDDEEVTFGRSNKCSVRLYYAFVSELHCILRMSEERKAFLVVKGANGVVIDGCEVLPTPGKDTTVPLINGSEIEIHKKTFRFEYPPKEVRAALLFTPRTTKKSRRSLRMSMIASAQVFTPQKSSPIKMPLRASRLDEEEQWIALRSPVKVSSEEQETLLIEGTGEDTVVVEEEKDLIILEHVEEQPESIESLSIPLPPKPQTTTTELDDKSHALPLPPRGFKTPPNRRKSGLSLHRAVVLRSAHRAYLEQERRVLEDLEDEHEEDEVELAVSPERDLGPFGLYRDADRGDNDNEAEKPFEEEVYDPHEEDNEDEDERQDVVDNEEPQEREELEDEIVPSALRSSPHTAQLYSSPLETIKADSNIVKKLAYEVSAQYVSSPTEGEDTENRKGADSRRYASVGLLVYLIEWVLNWRQGKPFMTPQPLSKRAQRVLVDIKPRQTLAGGELFPLFGGARRVPRESLGRSAVEASLGSPKTQTKLQVAEEERQAIMERRRSALQMPTMLPPPGPRSNHIDKQEMYVPGQNNEDTETMLERMKVKLEAVRRKSEVRMARLSHVSPQKDISLSTVSSPSWRNEPKSRTLRIAEESLRQMKLEDNDEEQSNGVVTPIHETFSFPRPRFETARPHNEPQTPSFIGMKKMFNTMPASGTLSFVGMKEMYKATPFPTTPIMRLDEMFVEEESGEQSKELQNLKGEAAKPPVENTISRLPTRKGWGRKRATPAVCEVVDVDAHTTQPVRGVVAKAVEPLAEVQNSQDYMANDEQELPRRITRSRGAKSTAGTVEEPMKRATRQTKKQQTNITTEESARVRRGRTKQLVEQVKKEDSTEVPKPSTRRKPRAK